MARTTSSSRSQAGSSASAPASATAPSATSSSTTAKVVKRTSSRTTRQSSRLANAISSGSLRGENLENMVQEAQTVVGQSTSRSNGKARAVDGFTPENARLNKTVEDIEHEEAADFYRSICPITDKDEKPFRLLDLPPELRLEIYRACLTRPHSILLSRPPQVLKSAADQSEELHFDDDGPPETTPRRRARAATNSSTGAVSAGPHCHAPARSALSAQGTTTPSSRASSNYQVRFSHRDPPGPHQADVHSKSSNGDGSSRNPHEDPLLTNILHVSKEVYKEARSVLYSENYFTLDLSTAQSTLACLHQRSRRQIKHIALEIPSYNDILERFQETVRLSLRYCTGLKECRIGMPFTLPGAEGSGTSGNTTVYANGFDILRWLPQECNIVLKGTTCVEIEQVVNKHRHLANTLDKLAYARRQLISNETGSSQS